MQDPGEWMTLSVAAERLGWHLHRIQSRARRDEWRKRPANRGRAPEYLVPPSLLAESAQSRAEPGAKPTEPPDELVAELRASRDKVLAALAELTAESTQLRERAARAQAQAEERDRLIGLLQEELRLARLPWWRRLLRP